MERCSFWMFVAYFGDIDVYAISCFGHVKGRLKFVCYWNVNIFFFIFVYYVLHSM